MLAYRHAFHAGNHADVLKHLVLMQVLTHLNTKDKPYTLVDTHAGAGGYSLESRYAQTKHEWVDGIGRLWDTTDELPAPLAELVALVRRFNGDDGSFTQYPGSPAVAQMLLRADDRLRLYELHPTEQKILASFLADRPNTQVAMRDGFESLKSELPPPSRRGAVLIDPSYEMKTDYARVVAAVRECLQRFATGTVMVWLPQVQLVEARELPRRLANAAAQAPRGWLQAGLTVASQTDARGYGMTGSDMFIVNPPHGLQATLQVVLPDLARRLAQIEAPGWRLEAST